MFTPHISAALHQANRWAGGAPMAAFAALLALWVAGTTEAATLWVGGCGPGANYASIAVAVSAAGTGDEIRVCAGTYNESVTVSKDNLTIRGATGNRTDVAVMNNGIPFRLVGANITLKDMTVTSTHDMAIRREWAANPSAYTFENLTISAKDKGVFIDTSAKVSFANVAVTSSNGDAIYLDGATNGAHVFDTLTVSAPNGFGIYSYNGGVTFKDITVTSKRHAIYLRPSYDAAFINVTATSDNDSGIYLDWAPSDKTLKFSGIDITAKDRGIYIARSGALSFRNMKVSSSQGHAIHLDWGANGAHVFDSLTLDAKDSGIFLENQSPSVTIGNVCVNSGQYGVSVVQWQTHNVGISNSKFVTSSYGVRTDADWTYKTTVANSCFMKSSAPRAWSNSTTHKFDGNYWNGVPGGRNYVDGNVRDNRTLASCPVTRCYGEATVAATLVADWRMDEPAWSGAVGEVRDSSGHGLHATSANGANTVAGKLCQAGRFDGTNDYVEGPDHSLLNPRYVTFGAWVQVNGRGSHSDESGNTILARGRDGYPPPYAGWALGHSDGNGLFYCQFEVGSTVTRVSSRRAFGAADGWHHVMCTYDQLRAAIYVDGALDASTPLTGEINYAGVRDKRLQIGRWGYEEYGRYFNGLIDEVKVFDGALSEAEIAAGYANEAAGRNWDGTVRSCLSPPSPNPTGFNCVAVGTAAADGHLYTQLVGQPFRFDIVALKADGTVENSYAAGGDRRVSVELVDGAGATACASRPVRASWPAQTFQAADQGRITASASTISNAYANLRCRVSDGSVTGCSSDNFSIRPAGLTVSSNANADVSGASTSAAPTVKAGAGFTLTATAVPGYDGTPTLNDSKVEAHPGAAARGTLAGGFAAADAASGVAAGTFAYGEVGYFRLAPQGVLDTTFTAVDAAQGDCTADFSNATVGGRVGCWFGNPVATGYFGRFIPDHFALAPGSLSPGCGSFTYYGQDFSTSFTIFAHNAGGVITQNYEGAFARLDTSRWAGYGFAAAGVGLGQGSQPPNGTWNRGGAKITATHRAARGGRLLAPASLSVTARPTDADGVSLPVTPVAPAAAHRFGRLRLANASGSELRSLPVPLTAQYWNGQGFVINIDDQCTTLPALVAVAQTTPLSPGLTFYAQSADNQLAAGETSASFASPLVSGRAGLILAAPGAGNHGFLDLVVDVPAWLRYDWDGTDQGGDGDLFDDNPRARATFGRRNAASKVIIRREIY